LTIVNATNKQNLLVIFSSLNCGFKFKNRSVRMSAFQEDLGIIKQDSEQVLKELINLIDDKIKKNLYNDTAEGENERMQDLNQKTALNELLEELYILKSQAEDNLKSDTKRISEAFRTSDPPNKLFIRKLRGETLSKLEETLVNSLSYSEQVKEIKNLSNTFKKEAFFELGDIIKVTFNLKYLAVKTRINKDIVVEKTVFAENGKSPNLEIFNYSGKNFNFHLMITGKEGVMSPEDVLNELTNTFWDNYISKMCNSNVSLESVQLKIVYPNKRKTPLISLAIGKEGVLDPLEHEIASRAFILMIASQFVRGGKDDFTIRVPFLSPALININSLTSPLKTDSGLTAPIVRTFCEFLSDDFKLFLSNSDIQKGSVTLHLVVKTLRDSSPLIYPLATLVSPVGYLSNSRASSINFPLTKSEAVQSLSWSKIETNPELEKEN